MRQALLKQVVVVNSYSTEYHTLHCGLKIQFRQLLSTNCLHQTPKAKTMVQIICSRGRSVEFLLDDPQILHDVLQDSTGHPLEFCKYASNVLELPISSSNAIKISTRRPEEFLLDVLQKLLDVLQKCSTGHLLQQKIWWNAF